VVICSYQCKIGSTRAGAVNFQDRAVLTGYVQGCHQAPHFVIILQYAQCCVGVTPISAFFMNHEGTFN
jgi:hypothetical protein